MKHFTFDDERYSLIRADGTMKLLQMTNLLLLCNGILQISNIGSDQLLIKKITLIATLNKINPK